MRNDSGFILPLTLVLMFLLTNFVLFELRQYTVEKQVYFESSEMYSAERLLQMATVDVEKILQKQSPASSITGYLFYEQGSVTYNIKKSEYVFTIVLVSQTKNGRTQRFTYTVPF